MLTQWWDRVLPRTWPLNRLVDRTDWLQAKLNKGGRVELYGSYRISRTLRIPANASLIGGHFEFHLEGDGSCFEFGEGAGIEGGTSTMWRK